MFVVIEGIDGAGCETQAKNLYQKLRQAKIKTSFFKYPNYEKNVGRFISDFLYKNKDLTPSLQFLLYSLQFLFDSPKIKQKRKTEVVVADRYFTSTLCYQVLEGFPLKKALIFADDFRIEKPDLVFYLKVKPQLAIERKLGEVKQKNRREKDTAFIKKTYKKYQWLVKNQVWTKWITINGEREINQITKDIFDILKRKITL